MFSFRSNWYSQHFPPVRVAESVSFALVRLDLVVMKPQGVGCCLLRRTLSNYIKSACAFPQDEGGIFLRDKSRYGGLEHLISTVSESIWIFDRYAVMVLDVRFKTADYLSKLDVFGA